MITAKQELVEQVLTGSSEDSIEEALQNVSDAKTEMMRLRVNVLRDVAAALPADAVEILRGKVEDRLF